MFVSYSKIQAALRAIREEPRAKNGKTLGGKIIERSTRNLAWHRQKTLDHCMVSSLQVRTHLELQVSELQPVIDYKNDLRIRIELQLPRRKVDYRNFFNLF